METVWITSDTMLIIEPSPARDCVGMIQSRTACGRFCLPRSFNLYTPQAPCRMALVAVLSVGQRCVIAFRRHRAPVESAQTLMRGVVIPPIHIQCASYCLFKLPSLYHAALRGRAGWGSSLYCNGEAVLLLCDDCTASV